MRLMPSITVDISISIYVYPAFTVRLMPAATEHVGVHDVSLSGERLADETKHGLSAYMFNTRRGRIKYSLLFIFSLFYEYSNLEYVHIHVIYRVKQAEYVIHILLAAP